MYPYKAERFKSILVGGDKSCNTIGSSFKRFGHVGYCAATIARWLQRCNAMFN